MGLDISVYTYVVLLDNDSNNNNLIKIEWNDCMPERQDDHTIGKFYDFDTRIISFKAGSYSGYNQWRDKLQTFTENKKNDPFAELIYFSDCKGMIGSTVSLKLYKDFKKHEKEASQFFDKSEYNLYLKWSKTFELASSKGFVVFN